MPMGYFLLAVILSARLFLGSLFEREIIQKLSSKINRAARRNYLGARLRHACIGSALAGRNLSKSVQNQTESLGEAPSGLLISRHAARGNYTTDLSDFTDFSGRTPKGILVFWVALRARN